MKFVGRIKRAAVDDGGMVRMAYGPCDVLVSIVEGEPCAIEDACNHGGASLAEGRREADRVHCPRHGYAFDLRSGALLAPRGFCPPQRRFVVRLEDDELAVYDPFVAEILVQ